MIAINPCFIVQLTAVLEINRLIPAYRKAVGEKNLEECKKCIKSYKGIEVSFPN